MYTTLQIGYSLLISLVFKYNSSTKLSLAGEKEFVTLCLVFTNDDNYLDGVISMDHQRTIAFEKLRHYCGKFGIDNVGQKIKDSLIRLTKNYCDKELEEIITKIIKARVMSG